MLSILVSQATKLLEAGNVLPDELLVQLVDQLIKNEQSTGGPYSTSASPNLLLNARILKLFILLDTPLPNVEAYIQSEISATSNNLTARLQTVLTEIDSLKNRKKEPVVPSDWHAQLTKFSQEQSKEVQVDSIAIVKKVIKIDKKGEISQLAASFRNSFPQFQSFADNTAEILGQANLMVWVAYSMYDAIIDSDASGTIVSTANIYQRRALQLFYSAGIKQSVFLDYLSQQDAANAWEAYHCRFVASANEITINLLPAEKAMTQLLSKRAVAHIIGPLCIAMSDNISFALFEKALTHYCIARQLNDDLHDWVEDFNAGIMSFVVARLLRSASTPVGTHNKITILSHLKRIFYDQELETICTLVEHHITTAIKLLKQAGSENREQSFVDDYLTPILHSAQQARRIHQTNKSSLHNRVNRV
ncbi:MAG: hypothetical protein WAQ27_00175 [Candidatus Microsaccharimonas sp.]